MHSSLGVFAKYPRPGLVKSRLAAATSPQWAAQVAEAFLRDTVAQHALVNANRFLVYSPPESESYFADLAGDRYAALPQGEGDLGQRMERFIQGQLQSGMEKVVLIGSDSPTLPSALVQQAFQELDRADVVIGPACDGGYYLVGCAHRLPPIFDQISWGTESVLAETMARLSDPGWRLALLPPWYDVDILTDWHFLKGHVAALRRAGIDPKIPFTELLFGS